MWTWSVQIEGKPEQRDGEKRDFGYNTVSPDYFPAMRMELTRGRNLAETDRAGAPPAMVINEALVRRFFTEGEDPIGQRMYAISRAEEVFEIVGVVEDTRHATLDAEPEPAYYVNYAQLPFDFFLREMTLALRTEADPASVVPAVRAAIAEVDPSIMVSNVATMRDRVVESTARTRFAMTLLVLFAGVALSLAVIGIYGVFAYSVGERKREIGVRLAIGADAPRIIRQFLGSGGRLILLGVGLGLVAAAGLTPCGPMRSWPRSCRARPCSECCSPPGGRAASSRCGCSGRNRLACLSRPQDQRRCPSAEALGEKERARGFKRQRSFGDPARRQTLVDLPRAERGGNHSAAQCQHRGYGLDGTARPETMPEERLQARHRKILEHGTEGCGQTPAFGRITLLRSRRVRLDPADPGGSRALRRRSVRQARAVRRP
jgi:hypothetical protein